MEEPMSDAGGSRGEIQVSPEEARFLRRFFRLQALPWMVVIAVFSIFAARWSAPTVIGSAEMEQRLAETVASVDALRAENAALRAALAEEAQRAQAALDRRVGAVEGRVASVEKRSSGSGSRAGDDVAERVAKLEQRLAAASGEQDTLARSNLARLRDLEARLAGLEGPPGASLPAAPAP
jgi:hypothetical protein